MTPVYIKTNISTRRESVETHSLPLRQHALCIVEKKGALFFSGALFACAIVFQRFGRVFSTTYLDAVTPIGLALVGIFVLRGTLVFNRRRLMIFGILCSLTMVGAVIGALGPDAVGGTPSINSLAQFLLLTSIGTLTFSQAVAERAFFRVVNRWIAVVAIAGVIEFSLQFIDVNLFTFSDFLPRTILVEQFWHVVIPIGDTRFFKSNGFFLLEPSLFSQYTALGLLIEMLVLRRIHYLCLFGAGLIISVSGTGWLMILGFIVTAVISLGGRGLLLGLATTAVGAMALGGLALVDPDIFHFLMSRTDEFTVPGSSGHLRFVTPWWLALDILNQAPGVILYGLGAGVSEHPGRSVPYDYNLNSIVKLLLEFGAPALISFLALFFTVRRTPAQKALVAPIMVWLLWDGTNVEIPFILLPSLLLLVIADLRADKDQLS